MSDLVPPIDSPDVVQLARIYDAVSKNIERENNLIHQRITWAILLSAGILAAEGVIVNYLQDHFAERYELHLAAQGAVILLTVVAIVFCAMSWTGVLAAHRQMTHIKSAYTNHRALFDAQGYPRPFGRKRGHRHGSANAFVHPFAMMVLWFLFLGAQVYQFGAIWYGGKDKFVEDSKSKEVELTRSVSEIARNTKDLITKINEMKPLPAGTKKGG